MSTRNVGNVSIWAIPRKGPPCGTEVTFPTLPQYLDTASNSNDIQYSLVPPPPKNEPYAPKYVRATSALHNSPLKRATDAEQRYHSRCSKIGTYRTRVQIKERETVFNLIVRKISRRHENKMLIIKIFPENDPFPPDNPHWAVKWGSPEKS